VLVAEGAAGTLGSFVPLCGECGLRAQLYIVSLFIDAM
jgi:hypothetical protein